MNDNQKVALVDTILAILTGDQPAKEVRKVAPTVAAFGPVVVPAPKVPVRNPFLPPYKVTQEVTQEVEESPEAAAEVITRAEKKAWNNKFSTLARTSGLRDRRGVTLYRVSMNRWVEVAAMRDAGFEPKVVLREIQYGKEWVYAPAPR